MEETTSQHIRILIVDDEPNIRFALREALLPMGYTIDEAGDGKQALATFHPERYDLVLMDYRMPEMDGMETLREIRKVDPDVPVIFITAFGSKDLALEAIREGAYDYFTKPFDVDEIRVVVRRALEKRLLRRRLLLLSRQMDASMGFDQIIGTTAEMRDIFRLVQKIAPQDVTVLILGESGTGKELIASAIHRHSHRRNGPFVPINCAAIPETLLESELFGHERGAFTGAIAQKIGKFEQANGGSIFLDEIGDMDSTLQAKLLRVLQDRQFTRVGGNRSLQADVRIIAATNKDLAKEVMNGHFREDLYFRLNVIPIFLPPLRNRVADIPPLIEHFVKQANAQYGKQISGLSREVMDRLLQYDWPGNIRELENVITRTVILAQGTLISLADLPIDFNRPQDTSLEPTILSTISNRLASQTVLLQGSSPKIEELLEEIQNGKSMQEVVDQQVDQIEKDLILAALEKNRWRRGETANFLGISRRNLLRKMLKLGIE